MGKLDGMGRQEGARGVCGSRAKRGGRRHRHRDLNLKAAWLPRDASDVHPFSQRPLRSFAWAARNWRVGAAVKNARERCLDVRAVFRLLVVG